MLQSQPKINNQVIALVLFVFFNLTSCNCGNNNYQGPSSSKTGSDTNNSGGTNPGTGTSSTGTGALSTGIGTPSTGTGGTPVVISPLEANPGGVKPPTTRTILISITPQEIDLLLQELEDGINPLDGKVNSNLKSFLRKVKINTPIDEGFQKIYLLSAIKYNNIPGYNTIDILKLAIDKSSDAVINTSYQGSTFLEYATYYNNTEATKLLILQGAK